LVVALVNIFGMKLLTIPPLSPAESVKPSWKRREAEEDDGDALD
jgi:hypothetical protein